MTFGQRLKGLRESCKMSRDDLATRLGLSYWAVAKYEQDERVPDHEVLGRIAGLFGTSIDYLLGRTDDPTPLPTTRDEAVETTAAHRTDDPMAELPEEARKSLREFQEYILKKYGKKTE
ncbi:MAG: helix-turn-helix domain-containing protein [Bacillota bacterium]